MKKKLLGISMCGGLILGITGCGTDKNEFDLLKGKWIATIENQNVYQINANGDKIGGKEDYILECDGNGNYILTLENSETKKGTYIIENDEKITFKDESNLLVGVCELSSDNEFNCDKKSTYALKYTKYSK